MCSIVSSVCCSKVVRMSAEQQLTDLPGHQVGVHVDPVHVM
jgi:hypothetical protein